MEVYKILKTMDNKALVSVVIPAFDADNFINGCLHAATHQTYRNIEIIIIDDGSRDLTRKTCEEYAENDERIKLFSVENSGVSNARNLGIENASGDYIVFFDADDRPERDLIESYLSARQEWKHKKVSFIVCGMFFDNLLNRYAKDEVLLLESDYGYIGGENYLLKRSNASTLVWLKLFNFVTNKFYDLKKIKEFGIRFDPDITVGEDLLFNLDYLEKCEGYIGMINRPLYHYMIRNTGSLSQAYHESDLEDTKTVYRRFLDWESRQDGVTWDKMMVIQGTFLTDWLRRLAAIRDEWEKDKTGKNPTKMLNAEVGSAEFQKMLYEVYKARKISFIRYLSLKTGNFSAFCFLRKAYKIVKG